MSEEGLRPLRGGSLVTLAALVSSAFLLVAAIVDVQSDSVDLYRDALWPAQGLRLSAIGLGAGLAAGGLVVIGVWKVEALRVIARRLMPIADWRHIGVPSVVAVAAIAAVGEEVLFRAAMQPLLGLAATSLIFGLLHWSSPAHAALATVAGAGLGWLYLHSGSLWPPVLAHFAVDLVTGLAAREAARRGYAP